MLGSRERCGTCRFWDYQDDKPGGTCLRYPPQINVITIPATGEIDWSHDRPLMGADDRCGEWRAPEEADHADR